MKSSLALAALAFVLPSLVLASTPFVDVGYSLKEQLKRSDLIAFVNITAAEPGNHQPSMYRANVTDSVKGAEQCQEVCFTLPIRLGGLEIGADYLIFLIQAPNADPETAIRLGCPFGTTVYQVGERFSRPRLVHLTRDVRQLCPWEDCPFGDWALEFGVYSDLPEFAVTYPVPGKDRLQWIRRSQLLRALRFKLSRENE